MLKCLLGTMSLLLSLAVHAEDAPGPHGGKIVQSEAHQFEVKIDSEAKNIEVYTLHAAKAPPRRMTITLFRDTGSGRTITLNAVNLKDPLPKYQGELSPSAGSYVGAELRFETNFKSFKVLKFIPQIRSRAGN